MSVYPFHSPKCWACFIDNVNILTQISYYNLDTNLANEDLNKVTHHCTVYID